MSSLKISQLPIFPATSTIGADSMPVVDSANSITKRFLMSSLLDAALLTSSTTSVGTFASRPAAGTIGRYYFASDLNVLFIDNGVSWKSIAPGQLYKQTGNPAVDITNSTTKTNIWTVTIPANSMGTNGQIRIQMRGIGFNNNAGGDAHLFEFAFGGSNLWAATQPNGAGVPLFVHNWDIFLSNSGATNIQFTEGTFTEATVPNDNIFSAVVVHNNIIQRSGAIDTTVDQTLAFYVTLSAASNNLYYKHYYTTIEMIL